MGRKVSSQRVRRLRIQTLKGCWRRWVWEPWESVSFKPAGDGFEDEGLFCHDQAERTYLLQYGADSMYTKALLMWARR